MFLGVSGKWQVSTLKLCVNTVVLNVSKAPYGLFRANGRIPKDTNINYAIQCASNPHWTSYLNWFEKLKCTKALYKVYGKWNSKITILMQQKLSNSGIKFTTHFPWTFWSILLFIIMKEMSTNIRKRTSDTYKTVFIVSNTWDSARLPLPHLEDIRSLIPNETD